MIRGTLTLAAACGSLLLATPVRAGEPGVDATPVTPGASNATLRTSLVWIFGDDDLTHASAETAPPSPASGIGDRAGYASLFEGFASRYTGRENWSELRLDGEAPGLFPRLTTRARLALGFDLSALGSRPAPVLAEDLGSFAEIEWSLRPPRSARRDSLCLRLLPLNGDRERVGELEALAWGGAVGPSWASPYAGAHGPVRAGSLELSAGAFDAHLGLKTASFLETQPSGPAAEETSYGVYGGASARLLGGLRLGFGVGHFEHGRLPGPAGAPRATSTGASGMLAFARGLERARPPVAFLSDGSPFDPPLRVAGTSAWALGIEAAYLVERLWDFDNPGVSVRAPARALAALAEVAAGVLDVRAAFVIRDARFVMRNGGGPFDGQTWPARATERPELGAMASVAALFGDRFEPSLSAGVLAPAALTSETVDKTGALAGATLVLRGPGDFELLPPGASPVPVLDARPALRVRLSTKLDALGFFSYRRDFNRTRVVAGAEGALSREFQSPDRFGYGLAARAVW